MVLLKVLDLTLPLKNPVIIFSLVLFIILFAPIFFNKIKVPHIIGLIVAGVIVGPYGLNLLLRDSSIVLFGTVGLLYIMFLSGLEIDLAEFNKNKFKIFVFGISTFLLPLIIGTVASYYILHFGFLSSLLLASMFSTHTLVSYPIASKYGIVRNRAVILAVGGTMITDILALLVLAGIAGMSKESDSTLFWIQLSISTIIFVCIVFFVFPRITRWFFKHYEDNVSQYIFVLGLVFLGSFLAEAAGLEAIIGAFFSGLVLNRFVPHSSALMNRINFVGNAMFIPFFLISVGMLVDVRVLVKGWGAIKVAAVIAVIGIATKYIAARFTEKVFKMSRAEGRILFGLSTSHAAATLAIILVGYNIIIGETPTGEPIRLLNEDVLNGTILLILISCAISSFVVEKASSQLALNEEADDLQQEVHEKILISIAYPETVNDLVDLGMMMKPKRSTLPVFALNIVTEEGDSGNAHSRGKKMMEKAISRAASTENTLIPLSRFDMNISNGIVYTIKEQNITDVLIGLHQQADEKDFFGATTERILKKTYETIYIYKSIQPVNTLKRMVVATPPKAELEPGFAHWFLKLSTISKEAGIGIIFYGTPATLKELQDQAATINHQNAEFKKFSNWDDFLIFSRELKPNDLFVIISSRKGHASHNTQLDKMPYYLSSYFTNNSFMLLYPQQLERGVQMNDIEHVDSTLMETLSGNVGKVGKAAGYLSRILFRKNK